MWYTRQESQHSFLSPKELTAVAINYKPDDSCFKAVSTDYTLKHLTKTEEHMEGASLVFIGA